LKLKKPESGEFKIEKYVGYLTKLSKDGDFQEYSAVIRALSGEKNSPL
jgi:hypothetical protein